MAIVDQVLRVMASAAYGVLKATWFLRRPRTFGVHAAAVTPRGTIVLVKLRYAAGWRLPGGGRKAAEDPVEAVLRELREEIGMRSHGVVQLACEREETPNFKRDNVSLFVIRDVEYCPRWSFEVEAVMDATLDALPPDVSPITARWLDALRPIMQHPRLASVHNPTGSNILGS